MSSDRELGPQEPLHDRLTGLLTGEGFMYKLEDLVASRPGGFSVLIGDIDGLKPINDEHGHPAGDDLLKRAGLIIFDSVRHKNKLPATEERENESFDLDGVAAHISGDEFGVVLPGVLGLLDLENVRLRIESNLEAEGISASFGGRPHRPDESIERLVQDSDRLMYEVKEKRKLARFNALPLRKRVAAHLGLRALKYAGMNPPR